MLRLQQCESRLVHMVVAHCLAGTARPKHTSARLHQNQCRPFTSLLSSPPTILPTRAMVLSYKVQRREPKRPRSARPAPHTRARRGHPGQSVPPGSCPQPACPSAPADSDSPWCRPRGSQREPGRMHLASTPSRANAWPPTPRLPPPGPRPASLAHADARPPPSGPRPRPPRVNTDSTAGAERAGHGPRGSGLLQHRGWA